VQIVGGEEICRAKVNSRHNGVMFSVKNYYLVQLLLGNLDCTFVMLFLVCHFGMSFDEILMHIESL